MYKTACEQYGHRDLHHNNNHVIQTGQLYWVMQAGVDPTTCWKMYEHRSVWHFFILFSSVSLHDYCSKLSALAFTIPRIHCKKKVNDTNIAYCFVKYSSQGNNVNTVYSRTKNIINVINSVSVIYYCSLCAKHNKLAHSITLVAKQKTSLSLSLFPSFFFGLVRGHTREFTVINDC